MCMAFSIFTIVFLGLFWHQVPQNISKGLQNLSILLGICVAINTICILILDINMLSNSKNILIILASSALVMAIPYLLSITVFFALPPYSKPRTLTSKALSIKCMLAFLSGFFFVLPIFIVEYNVSIFSFVLLLIACATGDCL